MLEEQVKTVRIFREHYSKDSVENMVIYGTGVQAEALITACEDYPIAGLMDASRTGESLWGKRVLSKEEAAEAGVRLVVVAARPAVHSVIYKRLKQWSREYGVCIRDIQGKSLADKAEAKRCDSPYFEKSYGELLEEIDRHDVISFDIFDTLLVRKVYEPKDVFTLLDLEYGERYPFVFSEERIRAQRELEEKGETDIYRIYRRLRENNPCLAQKECDGLREREIEKERMLLTLRRRMADCLEYCLEKGKTVYLVSDMYLPEKILAGLLGSFGITRYDGLFVSCDYGVPKEKGLFLEVKKQMKKGSVCLHVGDHPTADKKAAEESGMDSFLIFSPMRMLEISACSQALVHLGGIESRVMLGLMAAEIFNDPFILYHSEGKPLMVRNRSFGYVFVAPLVLSFLVWMIGKLQEDGKGKKAAVLFAARDGWLVREIYHMLVKAFRLPELPGSRYLLISRKAVRFFEDPAYSGERERYLGYLAGMRLEGYEHLYFFDFMSSGTCQCKLEQLLRRKLYGLYFQKSRSGDKRKDGLAAEGYFKESSALDSERKIFGLCDFLECILTSFRPSFLGISEEFQPVYEEERRTEGQLECVKEIHQGIQEYCREFAKLMVCFPEGMPGPDFCDGLLGFINSDFFRVEIPEIEEMVLDDGIYGDKNTGRDVLL